MQKQFLAAGQIEVLAVTTAAPVVTFRVPRPKEVDPFFGGTRTFWLQRTLRTKRNNFKPEVESFVVRQPGSSRGIRFISYASALVYFNRLRASQSSEAVDQKTNCDKKRTGRTETTGSQPQVIL